jgi:hypothetical protein
MPSNAPVVSSAVMLAGSPAAGEYHCASCGYGIAVSGRLPECPMCRGDEWEAARWRPFTRASQPPKSWTNASHTR